jgi:hypothetical protein
MLAAVPLEGLPKAYPPGTARRASRKQVNDPNARTMPGLAGAQPDRPENREP